MPYDVLIIARDPQRRDRLKEATSGSGFFGKVYTFPGVREAQQRLFGLKVDDVALLSVELDSDETQAFITHAKSVAASQDCAFVQVLDEKNSDATSLTSNILSGADGVLVAPFSVLTLHEVVQIADRVRTERTREREQILLKALLASIVGQLQITADLLKAGDPTAALERRNLRKLCSPLAKLNPDSLSFFHEMALETLINLASPTRQSGYTGASSRVRKRFEEIADNE